MLRITDKFNELFSRKDSEIVSEKQNPDYLLHAGVLDFHPFVIPLLFYCEKNLPQSAGRTGQSVNPKFNLRFEYKIP